jgi:hypothetical protein
MFNIAIGKIPICLIADRFQTDRFCSDRFQTDTFHSDMFCLGTGEMRGLSQMSTAIHRSLIKLWRSNTCTYLTYDSAGQLYETAGPGSQFLHSCFGERFLYSHNRSAYSAARK